MKRRALLSLAATASLTSLTRAASGAEPAKTVRVRVETALGAFVLAVDAQHAPLTAENFLRYVDAKLLDGGSVYRIVSEANQPASVKQRIQVVQWGMNLPDDKPTPFPPIAHETTQKTGLRHRDGTISMARKQPGSAAAEFFICIGDQPALDFGGLRNPDGQGFAAFGQVVEGMDVVRALHAKAQARDMLDQPIAVRTVRRG
ncbi:peptidylprolyl isomerase [Paucibacter sp. APW11]|uniref:peptidylprolyl isomerase n=1 Tax=Roseateles aquae TaxID=3077235 RepID=A0ABU3P7U1_9BURK|nr:peptidylprolyl isomerase [Paucibacter sp. APW11]MDT8998168.1 peptidylprolyl isomerase [Paucibacter sp. APW11]